MAKVETLDHPHAEVVRKAVESGLPADKRYKTLTRVFDPSTSERHGMANPSERISYVPTEQQADPVTEVSGHPNAHPVRGSMLEVAMSVTPGRTIADRSAGVSVFETRTATIITAQDKAAYQDWLGHKSHRKEPRLDLTPAAIRFLIPPRVLELADDPAKVAVRIQQHKKDKLAFHVVEADNEQDYSYFPDLTLMAAQGHIEATDNYFNSIRLRRANDPALGWCLTVDDYDDLPQKQGMGVATSFYGRLNEFAGLAGFRFIAGTNKQDNIGFYTGKLGRTRAADLPGMVAQQFDQQGFFGRNSRDRAQYRTIFFVRPEDRAKVIAGK